MEDVHESLIHLTAKCTCGGMLEAEMLKVLCIELICQVLHKSLLKKVADKFLTYRLLKKLEHCQQKIWHLLWGCLKDSLHKYFICVLTEVK